MYVPKQGDIVICLHPEAQNNTTWPAIVLQVSHNPLDPQSVTCHLQMFPLGVTDSIQLRDVPFYRMIPDTRDPTFRGCWPTSHDHRMHLADPDEDATI